MYLVHEVNLKKVELFIEFSAEAAQAIRARKIQAIRWRDFIARSQSTISFNKYTTNNKIYFNKYTTNMIDRF